MELYNYLKKIALVFLIVVFVLIISGFIYNCLMYFRNHKNNDLEESSDII